MQRIKIRIKGHLDRDWSDALASLRMTHFTDGSTLLSGKIRDQAALLGLVLQLSNLGLQLIYISWGMANRSGKVKEEANVMKKV
jgi:hypothetical protein